MQLTIISITKDDPEGLARTLSSTAPWREEAWVEQIVVDASVEPARVADGRIRVIYQKSRGIAEAFNEGLAEACGEWVWFLNGGDAVHEGIDPDWMRTLLSGTRAGMVTGGIHYDGEAEPRMPPPPAGQWPLVTCWLQHPATLVRRAAMVRAGGFDTRYAVAMDYDLWFRLLAGGTTVDVIALPLARFDVSGVSQRKDGRERVYREESSLIVARAGELTMEGIRGLGRVVHRLARAVRDWTREGGWR